jgi:hypothetical protein
MAPTACLVVNVMLVAAAIALAVKVGTSIYWRAYLVAPLAFLAHWPCWPTGLVGPLALLVHWPCWPTGLVGPLALLAHWPCWPTGLVGPQTLMSLKTCSAEGQ